MSGRVGLLSALLALQLVIIAAVLLVGTGLGEPQTGAFLEFEAADVDEVHITGGDDASTLVLSRGEDGWRLPDGLPASDDKVDDVLKTLAGLRSPWPVATSGGAARRFEVTDDNFQRHVVLHSGGDVVADLYLGTSPGYQQVHARRAGDDAVYSVQVSNYQLPAEADQWLDKSLLEPDGEISAVARGDAWRLKRSDEGWLLDAAEGEAEAAADQNAARELARRLAELRVTGVSDAPAEGAEPAAVLAVTDDAGTYSLSLFGDEDDSQYTVRSDRREGWFGLAGYLADQLLLERQALVPGEDAEPEAQDTSRAEGGDSGG